MQDPQAPRPWTLENLDDSGWLSGVTGVGFAYPELIGLDVSAMQSVNQTVYVRIPFEATRELPQKATCIVW